MKAEYDKATTVRELKPGDEALVLLPTSQNKLFAKWQGPFQVLRKCDDRNNYELQIRNRTAILHLNSLRKFHPPDQDTDYCLNMLMIDAAGEDDETDLLRFPDVPDTTEGVGGRSLTTSTDVYADDGTAPNDFGCATGEQLTPQETTRLRSLLGKFPEIFDERPGFTSVIEHKILVKDQTPIFSGLIEYPKVKERRLNVN